MVLNSRVKLLHNNADVHANQPIRKFSHSVQQQTRSVALLRKAQTTLFLICRVYKIVKKAFLHELKKTCITTGVLRPMHNKDKMRKKYLNVKIPNF